MSQFAGSLSQIDVTKNRIYLAARNQRMSILPGSITKRSPKWIVMQMKRDGFLLAASLGSKALGWCVTPTASA